MDFSASRIWDDLARMEDRLRNDTGWYGGRRLYDSHGRVADASRPWDLPEAMSRVQRVHEALRRSVGSAQVLIRHRLLGIDLSSIWHILIGACQDIAVYYGGSVIGGAVAGGVGGALFGGLGAVPGAAAGAAVGSQVGLWVLALLGLKSLVEGLTDAMSRAFHHYALGFREAWGPLPGERQRNTLGIGLGSGDVHRAANDMANGHVLMIIAILSALTAYLTRGRGDKALMLQEIHDSKRLGPKVAQWVEQNEDKLLSHPALQSRRHGTAAGGGEAPPSTQAPKRESPNKTKALKGEAAGQDYMQKNGFEKISSEKGWNAPGVDDIWKNPNPPPDYVVTEYKYGSSGLGSTKDGRQTSDDWLNGVNTGRDRIRDAVGGKNAVLVRDSIDVGGVEKWLLRVDESGNVTKQVLDAAGRIKGP
jgi:hypothetical protein